MEKILEEIGPANCHSERVEESLESSVADEVEILRWVEMKSLCGQRDLYSQHLVFRDDIPHSAAMNMAIDEALLKTTRFQLFVFIAGVPLPSHSDIWEFADVAGYQASATWFGVGPAAESCFTEKTERIRS